MSDLLTPAELEDLTGASYPSVQAAILERHGIFYIRRRDGRLSVTWHSVNNPRTLVTADNEPDFSGFDDGAKKKAS